MAILSKLNPAAALFAEDTASSLTPAAYAAALLASLDSPLVNFRFDDERSAAMLWAHSGAMALSGHAEGSAQPCPAPIAACAQGAWLALAALFPDKLSGDFPAYQLLGERAALSGYTRRGRVSAGGACRIFAIADGFIAVNLPRDDDFELLAAWLESDVEDWADLQSALVSCDGESLLERGRLLGLACALVEPPLASSHWYQEQRCSAPIAVARKNPLVIDLSSLWAGPLCGQLLAQTGARVIKVESVARPDGARFGNRDFFDLLNAGKESVLLDLSSSVGRQQLAALLKRADIVIESTRPRALEQMGIVAADIVAANPGAVWVGISGYGRGEPNRNWIAYGDDAGVAAGLSWLMGGDQGDPIFCADAIADPLTGLHAALLAASAWQQGGGSVLDISLHGVTSYCIQSGRAESDGSSADILPPKARRPFGSAAELGADTDRVLRELL
ncbi:CoA transferase [Zhongshania aquimaris]|uniref:CoA transferase n=1 Tax=Zhongshania aquimaris TaxID=2857107 RepID=A0ABS6VWS0_9GAMM|nr:CoA transferase [Zhongshania aquimaris]MBW2942753.1 CoA transferase [Zhongshania aquimaris]